MVKQFQLLDQAEIPVFLIRGNHDSREEMSRRVPWPRNVTLFDHVEPQTVELKKLGVAIHGLSFPKREVKENLVPRVPAATPGAVQPGVAPYQRDRHALHDPYAPCSVDELVLKGYDYWALGICTSSTCSTNGRMSCTRATRREGMCERRAPRAAPW